MNAPAAMPEKNMKLVAHSRKTATHALARESSGTALVNSANQLAWPLETLIMSLLMGPPTHLKDVAATPWSDTWIQINSRSLKFLLQTSLVDQVV
jgi:hypothetical protein